ncbi:helix-turn-helix domain-containing protein [Citrobacter freundii]|uniref:winged helix-turn-helix transcriptional regulator n=1 Tax=Citrobacter freundii TaxID=546 RepID=UPI0015E92ABF|nr:winged helix-turn-helix transcriptional regulator [Citrobacter freundii]QLR77283.1 helix-turn-helix domain-containing protein [Citrobacter freundii]
MPETKTIIESSMYQALPIKPVEYIENIIEKLKPKSNIYETKHRQIINYKNNNSHQCYLLLNGTISIFRQRDGFMLNSEVAPFIFGLSNQLADAEYLFMRCEECSTIAVIPLERANEVIADENLWESLAKLLIYTAGRVYDHCTRISAPTSYDIIRSQLYELMRESDEFRQHITAANYIQSRSFLSRSSIMKILAELKKGGYIVTERGVLKLIQQNIPLKY